MRLVSLLVVLVGCGGGDIGELYQEVMQCPTETLEGVDVYQGDGTIDWAMVKASGRRFAFMKASQGDYNKQSNFNANWANTKANGLVRGAYHYFDATVDGVAQANWFLAQIQAAGGLEPGDLPPTLDIECPVSTTQSAAGNICLGNGKSGWAATATVLQRAWDFLDTVEAAVGRKPIIYSYGSWFGTFGFTDPKLTEYPLWIANPTTNNCASVPAPWTTATFWQWSFHARVPGIGGGNVDVDADRFMGNEAQLMAFTLQPPVLEDGGVDAAEPLPDLAQPLDLTKPPADEPDLSMPIQKHDVDGGCGCQVGARPGFGAWGLILIVGLMAMRSGTNSAKSARRARARGRRR